MNIFGQRLRELRQNEGWTMKELGDLISNAVNSTFSSASVANWEKKGSEPPYHILAAIAQIFNVSADFLIGNSDIPKPSSEQIKHHQDKVHDVNLYLTTNKHEKKQDIYLQVKNIHQKILLAPPYQKNRLEKELTEYLAFFDYKYNQLHEDFTHFTNYLQYELKTPNKN
ncbi:transcriptional regulator [Bacillus thuringiensis]|uniref:helix-turn-helix domain-containing protein n=1 Tax=Bacillus thuringiensis TaxID=1428 RepID=UPI0018CF5D06|nr:helix-turn-helix transcriptional regulator [Bacillus thuringiensis]MBG9517033.1 transcriptional regulator [Bacillus thuringiensis]HDR4948837.1 helix-turn-helix transcriptional regulator [Bacillus cereus]